MDLEEIVLPLILFVVAFLLASCFGSEVPNMKKFVYLFSTLPDYSVYIQAMQGT